jgi:hypothetical protein
VVALLTRSLGQREAEKASIRSPFPEGRNRQVVSTDVKSDAKTGGCQSAEKEGDRYFFTLLASILIDVSRNLVVNAVSTANGFSMPR